MSDKTAEAFDTLAKAIEKDAGYRNAWRAVIAMAFQDELHRAGLGGKALYEVGNKAANSVLDQIIHKSKVSRKKKS